MLRKIRIAAAAVFFTVVTLLLLDFTGTLHAWFGWMAKVQLLPAILAVNAGVVAALVLLTLLFGRVYCSVICPLGVFQDVVSRAAARRRKNRFGYSRARFWDSCRALRFSNRVSTPRNVTVAAFVPATARRRASTRRRTGSITAVAWPAWTVWGNAARERSPFRANPLPAANPLPWNLRP